MTPRSRKYFLRKKTLKWFDWAVKVFHAHWLVTEDLIKRSQPIPNYPEGGNSGTPAIVGESGPELISTKDGMALISASRIFPLFEQINDMLTVCDFAERLRNQPSRAIISQGTMEWRIINFGTGDTHFTDQQPENP